MTVILVLGWALQGVTWTVAFARHGPGVERDARRGAMLLRLLMLVLVLWALAAPRGAIAPLPSLVVLVLLVTYAAGQLLAAVARWQLGARWGIGIEPRATLPGPAGPALRRGLYAVVAHPIYWGTGVALVAQAILAQNGPAIVLAAAAAIANPIKAARENRLLR